MIWPALLCSIGIPAGLALIFRVPTCPSICVEDIPAFSIVIPARNEEKSLPSLLRSIADSNIRPAEVIVVDDDSTDNTARIAQDLGARVIPSATLPAGWMGKTWACHQGAKETKSDLLFFLDADTYFLPGGLERIVSAWVQQKDPCTAISVLPYHAIGPGVEQLSIIFNLLMAAGAGGFGAFPVKGLFGQSLLIPKHLYQIAGGHQAVRDVVLENLKLAKLLRLHKANVISLAGRGSLEMRMFPEGFAQMTESWSKAFVQGARDSSRVVITSSILWISALWSCALLLIAPADLGRTFLLVLYLSFGLQLFYMARKFGRYRLPICLLYPVPLTYYCTVFGCSFVRQARGYKSTWRGREV